MSSFLGSILAALVLLAGCGAAPAAVDPPAPSPRVEIRPVLTAAVPAPPAPAASAAPVAAPALADYGMELAVALVHGKQRSILQASVPCATGKCARAPFELGPASSEGRGGLVDLLGPSRRVDHQGFDGMGLPAKLPGSAGFPAAMILVGDPSGTRLIIVSLREDPPVEIFSEALSSRGADGGGFSTINSIELEPVAGGPLDVSFSQTSLPGKGSKPFRPGPPLHRRYHFDGRRYELQR